MEKNRAELNVKFIIEEGSKLVAIEAEGVDVISMITDEGKERFANMSAEIAFAGMMVSMKKLIGE